MKIRIKKLHPDAVIPKYATSGSAGFDFVAIEDVVFKPWETKLIRTGLAIDIGFGYQIEVRPRSGMTLKTPMRIPNSSGTVDSDFVGEICIIMTNSNIPTNDTECNRSRTYTIKKGDRVAQGVVMPAIQADMEEVDELSTTIRGEGGFGSTGT